jgi:hypothetical protein
MMFNFTGVANPVAFLAMFYGSKVGQKVTFGYHGSMRIGTIVEVKDSVKTGKPYVKLDESTGFKSYSLDILAQENNVNANHPTGWASV